MNFTISNFVFSLYPSHFDYVIPTVVSNLENMPMWVIPGNTKGESITVPLTSCLTGLKIKTKFVSCHTADSKPVKQEVNSTVILPPSVFSGYTYRFFTNMLNKTKDMKT
jgi:hypothetical protein